MNQTGGGALTRYIWYISAYHPGLKKMYRRLGHFGTSVHLYRILGVEKNVPRYNGTLVHATPVLTKWRLPLRRYISTFVQDFGRRKKCTAVHGTLVHTTPVFAFFQKMYQVRSPRHSFQGAYIFTLCFWTECWLWFLCIYQTCLRWWRRYFMVGEVPCTHKVEMLVFQSQLTPML